MKKKITYRAGRARRPQVLKDASVAPSFSAEVTPSSPMVRTQIYLSQVEHEFIQTEATRRNQPMAAVIRSFIDEKMTLPDDIWENNPLLAPPADPSFVGPEDGAINHDHYVYGGPKKWMKRKGKWVEAPPLPDDYYTHASGAAAYDRRLEEAK
jgi:hypothetical protein